MLVVRGMRKDLILLRTRGMTKDAGFVGVHARHDGDEHDDDHGGDAREPHDHPDADTECTARVFAIAALPAFAARPGLPTFYKKRFG